MGSGGNQNNPWAPYESYRDCSAAICTSYCPQWCYLFPPPPPLDELDEEDSGSTTFSPLIIAIISILASALLLVTYYTFITKYCRRRRRRRRGSRSSRSLFSNSDPNTNPDHHLQTTLTGLDDAILKSITVCKYVKGDGLIEGSECAVCLAEFLENESLRLLPKCTHAFHLPCIDTWLKTHSTCPLCRSSAVPPPLPPPPPAPPAPPSVNVSAMEMQRQSDLVLVVEDSERRVQIQPLRRSASLDRVSGEGGLVSIADVLEIQEDEDGGDGGGGGSTRECPGGPSKPGVGMKRSVSTGRFIVTHGEVKGKNSIA